MNNPIPPAAIVAVCRLLSKDDTKEPVTAFRTDAGYAVPELLSAAEALALFESGDLLATDMQFLSERARAAVTARLRGIRVHPWCMRPTDQRDVVVAEGTH